MGPSASSSFASSIVKVTTVLMQPNRVWIWVFLPALSYYMATRLHSWGLFRSSSVGEVMETAVLAPEGNCELLSKEWLYLKHRVGERIVSEPESRLWKYRCANVSRSVFKLLEHVDSNSIVATAWAHDEELGRGYLLLSTSQGPGKIWQWETGGGPIPIGKTLHLLDSGCRSKLPQECSKPQYGSGGIIVDTWHDPPRMLVAEWGQGRIVRLEPESGARTPVVMQYPYDTSGGGNTTRFHRPRQLLLTAFGDLIVLESTKIGNDVVDGLWQIPQVSKIAPLPSLYESRLAHNWTSLSDRNTTSPPILPQPLLYKQGRLGGISLVNQEWMHLYVSVQLTTATASMQETDAPIALIKLSLGDEDEDDQENEKLQEISSTVPPQSAVLLDYSAFASQPGPIEVDAKGYIYVAADNGILLVSPRYSIVGILRISGLDAPIVSLTLGEDKFLYAATSSSLYRVKVRHGPLSLPTDLVVQTS